MNLPPIDPRPIYWDNCAPIHVPGSSEMYPDNPRGYQSLYLHKPFEFMQMQFDRGPRLVLRLEFPTLTRFGTRSVPSSCWENIDTDRREIIVHHAVRKKREDPANTFGLYVGHWWGHPAVTDMRSAVDVMPNLDLVADRAVFERNFLPWLKACDLYEIVFDAASAEDSIRPYLKLAETVWKDYGIKVLFEPYPHVVKDPTDWPGSINWDNWPYIGLWALASFYFDRDPVNELRWREDTEVHIASTPHERGPSAAMPGFPSVITRSEAVSFRERNFIVGSARPHLDYIAEPVGEVGVGR